MTDIYGTAGNDTLTGTALADRIYGLAGNDVLSGLDGNDELYGGDGNDLMSGGTGNDALSGGNGVDYAYGGAGNDFLYSGVGVAGPWHTGDHSWGGAGADWFAFAISELTAGDFDYIEDFASGDVLYGWGTTLYYWQGENVEGLQIELYDSADPVPGSPHMTVQLTGVFDPLDASAFVNMQPVNF